MARTTITPAVAGGTIDPAKIEVVPTDGDTTNNHDWALQEGDVVIVYNNGASAVQATLKGSADVQGRTADSVESIAVGSMCMFGPLKREGWEQSGGLGWLDVDTDTDPQIVVLRQAGKF